MNLRKTLLTLAVAAITIPLLKALYDRAQTHGAAGGGTSSGTKKMIGETLRQHQHEESAFVQAFEEALGKEAAE